MPALSRHPELERHSRYDSDRRVWLVFWTNPLNNRKLVSVEVDDRAAAVVSSDINSEALFDILPFLSETEATDIAREQPKVKDHLKAKEDVTTSADLGADSVWTVSFFSGTNEVARVLVNDGSGSVREVMTGPQVAWQMARGYKGAFGRIVTEPYVWIPLCVLFLLPFVDLKRPLKLLHLDLLALLSFSVSHYFFNQGEIFKSVPLVYPPLLYLFLRLGWMGTKRAYRHRPDTFSETEQPLAPTHMAHINFSPRIMLAGLLVLLAFRIVINVADSNVVDVGYSGVIGADLIQKGETPYGNMPEDDSNGDTYGPLNYLVYIPFEKILPWSGGWDELPAAHATAIFFDLATVAGMFMLGRRLAGSGGRGNRLGLALAYGWVAYPYTAFVLNSNVNDTIVAAFIVWGLFCLKTLPLAGLMLGFATQIKFFPAILAPLWASFPAAFFNWKKRVLFLPAFAVGLAVVMPVVFIGDGSLSLFWERSVKWQMGRESPFSIWGQYPQRLADIQAVGQYLLAGLALGSYIWPPRKTMVQVAACSAALIVGFQIMQTHWFYLYIPWFFPLALVAFLTGPGKVAGGERLAAPA